MTRIAFCITILFGIAVCMAGGSSQAQGLRSRRSTSLGSASGGSAANASSRYRNTAREQPGLRRRGSSARVVCSGCAPFDHAQRCWSTEHCCTVFSWRNDCEPDESGS